MQMDRIGFEIEAIELGGRISFIKLCKNGDCIYVKDYIEEIKLIKSQHLQREFLYTKWDEKYSNKHK